MQGWKSGDAPISKGDRLHKGQCPKNVLEAESMKNVPYARLVGSLMYAQICTRPDISFAVNMLSRFQSNAGHEHWIAGKKVLRYLKKTKDHMLVYRKIDEQELEVEAYTDASYKSDMDDLKSTSGYIFLLAGGAILWKTAKQTLTATSTFQAEYIAIYEATGHALWLRNFISHLKLISSVERPMVIYCDNASAMFFSKNNKRSSGSRNIDVKYFAVRESVRDEEIEVVKIETKDQLADPLTKALPVADFVKHAAHMGIKDII
ncbi:putative RNA-directed DNA polymerase [Rosa chinensis]|uniref:Putative RNA-directed DNA polymerase n=1 Tax=Rosa chinensis TaxID=74649 RepID=A0A2P6QNZ2_ROSCH|nr:putative RNA-directed DNA polymerase [Rosa chinensis]